MRWQLVVQDGMQCAQSVVAMCVCVCVCGCVGVLPVVGTSGRERRHKAARSPPIRGGMSACWLMPARVTCVIHASLGPRKSAQGLPRPLLSPAWQSPFWHSHYLGGLLVRMACTAVNACLQCSTPIGATRRLECMLLNSTCSHNTPEHHTGPIPM